MCVLACFLSFLESEVNFHRSSSANQSSDGKVEVAVRVILHIALDVR